MAYQQFLTKPQISTAYQNMDNASLSLRLEMAQTFLSNKEFHFPLRAHIDMFNDVETVLKSKVLTYGIAFAKGARNGGMLYANARADLHTWWAIFEGARFENGWLV